jgi:hypothetical protein
LTHHGEEKKLTRKMKEDEKEQWNEEERNEWRSRASQLSRSDTISKIWKKKPKLTENFIDEE